MSMKSKTASLVMSPSPSFVAASGAQVYTFSNREEAQRQTGYQRSKGVHADSFCSSLLGLQRFSKKLLKHGKFGTVKTYRNKLHRLWASGVCAWRLSSGKFYFDLLYPPGVNGRRRAMLRLGALWFQSLGARGAPYRCLDNFMA